MLGKQVQIIYAEDDTSDRQKFINNVLSNEDFNININLHHSISKEQTIRLIKNEFVIKNTLPDLVITDGAFDIKLPANQREAKLLNQINELLDNQDNVRTGHFLTKEIKEISEKIFVIVFTSNPELYEYLKTPADAIIEKGNFKALFETIIQFVKQIKNGKEAKKNENQTITNQQRIQEIYQTLGLNGKILEC
jgi:hypothetical protein